MFSIKTRLSPLLTESPLYSLPFLGSTLKWRGLYESLVCKYTQETVLNFTSELLGAFFFFFFLIIFLHSLFAGMYVLMDTFACSLYVCINISADMWKKCQIGWLVMVELDFIFISGLILHIHTWCVCVYAKSRQWHLSSLIVFCLEKWQQGLRGFNPCAPPLTGTGYWQRLQGSLKHRGHRATCLLSLRLLLLPQRCTQKECVLWWWWKNTFCLRDMGRYYCLWLSVWMVMDFIMIKPTPCSNTHIHWCCHLKPPQVLVGVKPAHMHGKCIQSN